MKNAAPKSRRKLPKLKIVADREVPNRPGEFYRFDVTRRREGRTWQYVCRSRPVYLDERHVRYTDDQRAEFKKLVAWEIEEAFPRAAEEGTWRLSWRTSLALHKEFADAVPYLLQIIRMRLPLGSFNVTVD